MIGLCLALFGSVYSQAPMTQIKDKTLVAWVTPANLTQRGGSVLTIEKPGAIFDGIVFGELSPAAWMAGSYSFERTSQDQHAFPQRDGDRQCGSIGAGLSWQ